MLSRFSSRSDKFRGEDRRKGDIPCFCFPFGRRPPSSMRDFIIVAAAAVGFLQPRSVSLSQHALIAISQKADNRSIVPPLSLSVSVSLTKNMKKIDSKRERDREGKSNRNRTKIGSRFCLVAPVRRFSDKPFWATRRECRSDENRTCPDLMNGMEDCDAEREREI